MNGQKGSIMGSVPAAGELRKVPGFNPLKYLHPSVIGATGQKSMKLDLPYKRLWFRMACPKGRMMLNPLRITDQMAIFEARLYASAEDAEPIASFTSTKLAADVPGGRYIRDAQDEALNEALENAGFGIQLCDFVPSGGNSCYGSEIPLAQLLALAQEAGQAVPAATVTVPTSSPKAKQAAAAEPPAHRKKAPAVQQFVPAPAPVQSEAAKTTVVEPPSERTAYVEAYDGSVVSEPIQAQIPAEPHQSRPVEKEVSAAPLAAPDHAVASTGAGTADILQMLGAVPTPVETPADTSDPIPTVSDDVTPEAPAQNDEGTDEAAPPAAPSYSADMSVEDIRARMTLEEAREVKVDFGICKGSTLGWVRDKRPSSLRFYVYVSQDGDNVFKAAASLLFDEMNLQKAG